MQKIANIQAQRSELSSQQQQDIQRFEVVQSYFNVQLQQQLVAVVYLTLMQCKTLQQCVKARTARFY